VFIVVVIDRTEFEGVAAENLGDVAVDGVIDVVIAVGTECVDEEPPALVNVPPVNVRLGTRPTTLANGSVLPIADWIWGDCEKFTAPMTSLRIAP